MKEKKIERDKIAMNEKRSKAKTKQHTNYGHNFITLHTHTPQHKQIYYIAITHGSLR